MERKLITRLLPVFGFLFLTAYIRSAAVNVVYTDYIRLVNSYLEDVFSFRPYLHGDILTRIPANYPERILNVVLFRYSTIFDMCLGALFLALSAWTAGRYCEDRRIAPGLCLSVMVLLFSLNKWEMLTNGSGWVHFAAFALFWHHYLLLDRYFARTFSGKENFLERAGGRKLLCLPWIVILLFGGPYGGVYAATLLLGEGFLLLSLRFRNQGERAGGNPADSRSDAALWNRRRDALHTAAARALCAFLPLCLYLLSRAVSVEERAGATADSLGTVIAANPSLLPAFFVRSFSSMVIGAEAAEHFHIGRGVSLALGGLVFFAYASAFFLNFRQRLYERTVFPLYLLTHGFLSHVLVTASRWIFLNESYGMSSRYALQYQIGIAGILFTLAAARERGADTVSREPGTVRSSAAVSYTVGIRTDDVRDATAARASVRRRAEQVLLLLLVAGNLATTGREIHMAPYRQEHFQAMREAALSYRYRTDEELKDIFLYHDPQRIRSAMQILEEQGLNVFADEPGPEEVRAAIIKPLSGNSESKFKPVILEEAQTE